MASMRRVSLCKAQGSPSFSTSLLSSPTGSLPIRAPITPGNDSSEFEYNCHTDQAYSYTSSSIDNGSESEEYVSGEEFESASEKLFADEESLGNSVIDEEERGVTDEHNPVVESDCPGMQRVMPVAQLSMDDDVFEDLMRDEGLMSGETGDGKFSAIASAPRVKVSAAEEDKVELLVKRIHLL
ncbi:hypothetical protein GH714_029238 [Hevea brasiliensis]|uniref:Uncharacterized protein n=1 Tax=Hevea brasiliensis TaxID=3981 RepID=A0A6A6KK63_HEVBR|nr:hypothetical protein GH714_029238 [Hevea brasiliensis]